MRRIVEPPVTAPAIIKDRMFDDGSRLYIDDPKRVERIPIPSIMKIVLTKSKFTIFRFASIPIFNMLETVDIAK